MDLITWIWLNGPDHMVLIASTWSHQPDHMDLITSTWSHGSDRIDLITWTWSHGPDHMHLITWTWSHWPDYMVLIAWTWSHAVSHERQPALHACPWITDTITLVILCMKQISGGPASHSVTPLTVSKLWCCMMRTIWGRTCHIRPPGRFIRSPFTSMVR